MDGGVLERVSVSDCVIDGPKVPIFIRLGARSRRYVPDAPAPGVGTVNDISISHITAVAGGPAGCSISGIPGHDIVGVRLSDISVTFPGGGTVQDASRELEEAVDAYPEGTHWGRLPAFGFFIRHARDVQMTNIAVHTSGPDMRPAVVARAVSDLAITGLRAPVAPGAGSLIHFTDVVRAAIRSSSVLSDVPCFLAVDGGSANIALLSNDLTHSATPVCGSSANAVRMEGNLLREGK